MVFGPFDFFKIDNKFGTAKSVKIVIHFKTEGICWNVYLGLDLARETRGHVSAGSILLY